MKILTCAIVAGAAGALTVVGGAANATEKKSQNGLQVTVMTPDPSSISDIVSLDVVCKGGVLETIELYMDNALVAKRQIASNQTKNIISFKLDAMVMAAGDHFIVVKAYGLDGKGTTVNSRFKIPSIDLNAPVRIAYPQNGEKVNGTVPIRLSMDADTMRLKPYVTFFVDKEFKVLRNTPPFEYSWDTTRTANGWHVVEAWSQTGDAPSPIKARPVHVNVNNGGGETKLQRTVEDLRTPSKGINLEAPKSSLRATDPAVANRIAMNIADPRGKAFVEPSSKPVEPSASSLAITSSQVSDPGMSGAAGAQLNRLSPRASGGAARQPLDRMAIASIKPGTLPGMIDEGDLIPVIQRVTGGGNTGTVAIKPGETVKNISQKTGVSISEIEKLNGLSRGSKPNRTSLIVPSTGSFDVAFNGSPIVFDVQPRTEAGVQLAPFRQIFEHSGGRLYWFGGASQTVRAVNETREIEIKIGDKKATVNNQSLKMEKTPYILSGRTIVPLSFIRDSMDVKITFDEKTGRLLIESKK